jgi:hypothetical protein
MLAQTITSLDRLTHLSLDDNPAIATPPSAAQLQMLHAKHKLLLPGQALGAALTVQESDAPQDSEEEVALPTLPVLDAAMEAVRSLSKSDITDLKSFPTPPPLVKAVTDAVCVLLGQVRGVLLVDCSFATLFAQGVVLGGME